MAKILFSHSYYYKLDPKQWANKTPYPPYGTIYAAAYMRELGHEVSLFDTNLLDSPDAIEEIILKEKPSYLVIYDDGFNYLSKMCLTNMREACFNMIEIGKKHDCQVIISSSDSTDHFEKYLSKGADFILLGEAELTLGDLIANLESKEDFTTLKGIAYQNSDGDIISTTRRDVLKELDILPQPAWDLVDIKAYENVWKQSKYPFALNIATTRGCPYKCNWCAKPIYGNRYNSRSPRRVVDEIKMLNQNFGVSHFWMCDDIFGLKPNWVQEFRDLLASENLKISYKIQSRVDLLLKDDTIDALVDSGLYEVWVGAESGSQKILDAMDKGTQLHQIHDATQLLKSKGVRVAFFLQFGYLGENKEDIQKTIQMLDDLNPDDIGISVSYPLPGTGFYETVKHQFSSKENWSDSNDLAMMFKGTFNSEYYKTLHMYVHKKFRLRQANDRLKHSFSAKDFAKKLYYTSETKKYKSYLDKMDNIA